MSVFERKPGTDICDSCGTDLSGVERLHREIERLKMNEGFIDEVDRLATENEALKAKIADWDTGLPMRASEMITALEAMGGKDLRAENQRLTAENLKQSLHMAEKVEAFTAENARLREALEKIAACKHVGTKAMQMVQTIARAALQDQGGSEHDTGGS